MNYDIRNVLSDKKKLTIIAGVTVVGLTIGSVGLKVHQEKVNPSTSPVSADEVDSKDKLISQQQQLNAEKTKNKSKSNNSSNELVPYNLNGSLGSLGRYNSTPLSLGGDYNYTPTLEPTVYEPIIEPVEDEPVIEFDVPTGEELDTPTVEPIVNEAVAPPVTPPPVTNEEGLEEPVINEASKFDVNTATYLGRNIVKHLPNMTYDVVNTDDNVIIKVTGTNIQIEFTRVNNSEFSCTKLIKDGQELTGIERDKVLNELFNIEDGSNVPTPPEPPVIEVPDPSLDKPSDKPAEPEQPKDNVIDTNTDTNTDNTGVTAPPVTPPPAPPASEEQEVVVG